MPVVVPSLLAVVYVVLVAATLPRSEGGFSSLAGVSALFDNPWALLAGWTHYLAFDLFIGGWEVRDAQRRGIPHLLVVPGAGADVPLRAGGLAALSGDQGGERRGAERWRGTRGGGASAALSTLVEAAWRNGRDSAAATQPRMRKPPLEPVDPRASRSTYP